MNRDWKAYIPALLALGVLILIVAQTLEAFQRADRLGARPSPKVTADPFARLENMLTTADPGAAIADLRDPFAGVRAPVTSHPPVVKPVVAARPVVTAIVTGGSTNSAIVRFEGRSYTVKPGELFAGFQVISIDDRQVVLDTGRERIALQVQTKGR